MESDSRERPPADAPGCCSSAVRVKRRDVFVAAFVFAMLIGAILPGFQTSGTGFSPALDRVLTVIYPLDGMLGEAGWTAVGRLTVDAACLAIWSGVIGLLSILMVPQVNQSTTYPARAPRDQHSQLAAHDRPGLSRASGRSGSRWQFSLRAVLVIMVLAGVFAKFAGPSIVNRVSQWFSKERQSEQDWATWVGQPLGQISGVDRVVISGYGGSAWKVVVTDPAEIRSVTDRFAGCVEVPVENPCMEPLYCIELFGGDRVLLSACPTSCCGIFTVGQRIYRDQDQSLRDAIDVRSSRVTTGKTDRLLKQLRTRLMRHP